MRTRSPPALNGVEIADPYGFQAGRQECLRPAWPRRPAFSAMIIVSRQLCRCCHQSCILYSPLRLPLNAERGLTSLVGIVRVGEPEGRRRVADDDPGSTNPNDRRVGEQERDGGVAAVPHAANASVACTSILRIRRPRSISPARGALCESVGDEDERLGGKQRWYAGSDLRRNMVRVASVDRWDEEAGMTVACSAAGSPTASPRRSATA